MEKILVHYHNEENKLEHIGGKDRSNWIDLYTSKDYELEVGKFYLIDLGVSVKLPYGYEANIVPRSGTFKKYGIIQTNHYGVIDTTYCGVNDRWMMPVMLPFTQDDMIKMFKSDSDTIEFRKITIPKGTRLCQFRLNRVMESVEIVESDLSKEKDRNGFGSTGK
jgi:dUTP pyrophosphatase